MGTFRWGVAGWDKWDCWDKGFGAVVARCDGWFDRPVLGSVHRPVKIFRRGTVEDPRRFLTETVPSQWVTAALGDKRAVSTKFPGAGRFRSAPVDPLATSVRPGFRRRAGGQPGRSRPGWGVTAKGPGETSGLFRPAPFRRWRNFRGFPGEKWPARFRAGVGPMGRRGLRGRVSSWVRAANDGAQVSLCPGCLPAALRPRRVRR